MIQLEIKNKIFVYYVAQIVPARSILLLQIDI